MLQRPARSASAASFVMRRDRSGISSATATRWSRRPASAAAANVRQPAQRARWASTSRRSMPGSSPSTEAEIASRQRSHVIGTSSQPRSLHGSVVNPRFPAPVNTYNPTVHALVESLLEASSQITPHKKVGDGCSSRSIIIGGRSNKTGKGYVQYEIFGGGSGGTKRQRRRVRHQRQSVQRQDRADRDHRIGILHPGAAASN